MKTIKSIDLWTEQYPNHYECFKGAFIDGFKNSDLPYDYYKVVKNCNCIIKNNIEIPIGNKHNAIIFYKNKKPVRLLVGCYDSKVDDLLRNSLDQKVGDKTLYKIFHELNVKFSEIDLNEKPIFNKYNSVREIDAGSCNRFSLLKTMLSGNYTEDNTNLGHYDSDRYIYLKNLEVTYNLRIENECFNITHEGGFINDLKTSVIILQKKFRGN